MTFLKPIFVVKYYRASLVIVKFEIHISTEIQKVIYTRNRWNR